MLIDVERGCRESDSPFLLYSKLLRVGEPRPSQSPSVTALPEGEPRRESQGESQEAAPNTCLSPLGEVVKRSEDGEGEDSASVP